MLQNLTCLHLGSKSNLEEEECQQYHNPRFPYKLSLYTNQNQVGNFEKPKFRQNVMISCFRTFVYFVDNWHWVIFDISSETKITNLNVSVYSVQISSQ